MFCAEIGIRKVPTLVGIPEITIDLATLLNAPANSPASAKGAAPTVNPVGSGTAVTVTEKKVPTVPVRTLPATMVATGAFAAGFTTSVRLAVADSPSRVAVIKTGKAPADCVVPLIWPVAAEKLRPNGSSPERL